MPLINFPLLLMRCQYGKWRPSFTSIFIHFSSILKIANENHPLKIYFLSFLVLHLFVPCKNTSLHLEVWYLHTNNHQLDQQCLDNWYLWVLLWKIHSQSELLFYYWCGQFQYTQCAIKRTCDHRNLPKMCSLICLSQTI